MTRLIVVARNDSFPALNHSAQCSSHRAPGSARGNLAQPLTGRAPYSAAPLSVVSASSPPRAGAAVAPCATVLRAQGAPSYDATHDVWIIPPSGMTPDAGAAADLRHTQAAHTRSPVTPLEAGERLHPVVEALTVALGLTVFGLIAGFFLVMA